MNAKLGAAIRIIRVASGLTAEDVSARAGVQRSYLSEIETGKVKNITTDTLSRICGALDVTPAIVHLLAGDAEWFKEEGPKSGDQEVLSRLADVVFASVAQRARARLLPSVPPTIGGSKHKRPSDGALRLNERRRAGVR